MSTDASQDWEFNEHTDVLATARKALLQILEPMAGFVSDLGLSAGDFQDIFREAAIRSAAARQLKVSSRVNISGIAATTGITRSEISRILKVQTATTASEKKSNEGQLQCTNRMLSGWHVDPRFTGPDGLPADLRMYGRGSTFEALARRYGRGIPTRAVLDELIRAGAVELVDPQKIRVKALMTVDRGISTRAIRSFAERVSELLTTMLHNMKRPDAPQFIANVSETAVLRSFLPLFRKELSIKGADFLADLQESITRKASQRVPKRHADRDARVSITVYYHETTSAKEGNKFAIGRRRNFSRQG